MSSFKVVPSKPVEIKLPGINPPSGCNFKTPEYIKEIIASEKAPIYRFGALCLR
jgi:hypothetical protein